MLHEVDLLHIEVFSCKKNRKVHGGASPPGATARRRRKARRLPSGFAAQTSGFAGENKWIVSVKTSGFAGETSGLAGEND